MPTQTASSGSKNCRSNRLYNDRPLNWDAFVPEGLKMIPGNRIPTEHEEQRSFVSLWRRSGLPRIFAIPNGEARGIAAATRLKAEGVSPGVPDLYCPEWRLWIEFKRQNGGKVSKEQSDWHRYLEGIGDGVVVCKGAVDAVGQVRGIREDAEREAKALCNKRRG